MVYYGLNHMVEAKNRDFTHFPGAGGRLNTIWFEPYGGPLENHMVGNRMVGPLKTIWLEPYGGPLENHMV